MQENKLFEALLDVIPFAAYAVDIETYEVVYANKMMSEKMYAPKEEFCWKKNFGQEEVCQWCSISTLKQREKTYKNEKHVSSFFDESTDTWLQSYDELIKWPDGRTVKYTIAVDITAQKEIQASMIQTHTKMAMQSKKLKEANEKLEFLAKKDFLTKVDNRGSFFEKGEKTFQDESIKDIYVAMLDLDKFKELNDTYGHKVGDIALKEFASTVENIIDEKDIFGRLGGEEFALIFASYEQKDVLHKLELIRETISALIIESSDLKVQFTVSIGVTKKQDNETVDVCLERADNQLYCAKDAGRNRLKFRL